jgi:diguanylate cyclase (GGDEF)-like protein
MTDEARTTAKPEPPKLRLLNTPLGWPGASRALLLAWTALPLLVLAFMLSHTASSAPAWASIAEPHGMTMLSVVLGALALGDISLIALGMVLRGTPAEHAWYQLAVALFIAAAPLAGAAFLGLHVNGLITTLVAGSALCLLLLERWVALANIGAWLVGVIALTALEQAGQMSHTPALATVPMGPGGLHTGWLLGPGLMSVLAGLVALLVLDQIAMRERGYRHQLHAHIHLDPLSGLPDFSVLEAALQREIDRAQRHALPLCVAIMELDNLAAINRTMGYEVGDMLLSQAADRLNKGLRESDLASGTGDGRFIIMLPHLEREQVHATATRLLGLLNDQPLGQARSSIVVNARMGLAAWEKGLKGLELLGRASRALETAQQERGFLAAIYTDSGAQEVRAPDRGVKRETPEEPGPPPGEPRISDY